MNPRPLFYLSCFLAVTIVASTANAGPHRGGGNRITPMGARPGGMRPFGGGNPIAWNGQHWNGQHWNGAHWNNNWNWHHHHFNDVFVDFGFPFWGWWGYPWSYGYYPYGLPYGYFGYGNGYYGSSGYGHGNGYHSGSNVTDLQRKLTDGGYYHGPIDGIMGSRTRSALRAYRRDRGNGNNTNGGYSPTLRDRPYSPPPITTEPSPGE